MDNARRAIFVLLLGSVSASLIGQRSSGFIHPYLLQVYEKTTDQFGTVRSGVQSEDVTVWGVLDNGKTY